MNKNINLLPMLAVIGSIVSLSVGTSYGKQLFPVLGVGGTAAYRVVIAAIILLVVWRPWRSRVSANDFRALVVFGLVLGLMNFVFYQAIARLPLGVAIAIEFTGPLTVAIVSSRRLNDFVWIGLAALGLWLLMPLSVSVNALDPQGIGYALCSALLWALYIVFGKRLAHVPGGLATSWGMAFAAVTILPFGFADAGMKLFQPTYILPGIVLALACSAVPYTLEMFALKKLPKNTFSILLSMEPAVGALSGFFILHEVLSLQQWLAIACIVSASVGTTFGASNEPPGASVENIPADVL